MRAVTATLLLGLALGPGLDVACKEGTGAPAGTSGGTSDSDSGSNDLAGDAGAPAASSTTSAASTRPNVACGRVESAVTRDALLEHLRRLEAIAADHGGHRAAATPGYAASVAYVHATLRAAGLRPERAAFNIQHFHFLGPGTLAVETPKARVFRGAPKAREPFGPAYEFVALGSTPPGDVRAPLALVAVDLQPGNKSESGCVAKDFVDDAGHSTVSGKIALVQRGKCTFGTKVRNAEAAGALAVLVANQGDAKDRLGLMAGDLSDESADHGIGIPALFTTTAVGAELVRLASAGDVTLHVVADTRLEREPSESVVTEIEGVRRDEVVMLGAHLDSVRDGPGINDDGTGTATLLVMAQALVGCTPARTVRFAWWGAEELGLFGSEAYVAALPASERARLRGYLNLDMLGSPNHVFQLTDGDGSLGKKPGPATSAELEQFFHQDFEAAKLTLVEVPFEFRSDYRAFFRAGVGVVDLTAGADDVKTPNEVKRFGGTAGTILDPCYHRACDKVANIDPDVLVTIGRSVARALQHFGVEGDGLPKSEPSAPAGE